MRDDGFTCYDLACFLFALTLLLLYGNFAMLFFLFSRFCQATFVRIFTTIGSLTSEALWWYTHKRPFIACLVKVVCARRGKRISYERRFLSYLGDIFLKKWFCQWAVAPN